MRRVRYSVAVSLDGFIAGPNGEHDWIIMDSAIDFRQFFSAFDTVLIGRKTFEKAQSQGTKGSMPGMQAIVFSRSLQPTDFPKITIHADAITSVTELKNQPGKDIWLMGGGGLFRSLLSENLVDSIEVTIVPVLLGEGIPLLPGPYSQFKLKLVDSKVLQSGLLMLSYQPDLTTSNKGSNKTRKVKK